MHFTKKHFTALVLISKLVFAQNFTKTDSLKGSKTRFRDFWDVKKYEVTVEPDFQNKSLKGKNIITFEIEKNVKNPVFQIDLMQPMKYKLITADKKFSHRREGDFIFIESTGNFKKGEKFIIEIEFSGKPKISENAPWDSGWVFSQDSNGLPFIGVAQEAAGASLWLPIKDIWSDEPDNGLILNILTPKNLIGIGNGRLIKTSETRDKKIWSWQVKNPINAYSIAPSVGDYVNFKDEFFGEKGKLDLDFWVLRENLEKAKKQFQQVKPMLAAMEFWFGPYPFYEDSYKLVETPFLGMEHQSNVAYGNGYKNGYLGKDWSGTGVGNLWDFIIVHESGHEWFANSVTASDPADMWIHEAFTCYSETLFIEKNFSKDDARKYILGIRKNILNDRPVQGQSGVRNSGSSDMYWKGAAMLHTIRTAIDDDEKFRTILRGISKKFYHKTVSGKEIEKYISENSGIDFSKIFDQYLRTTDIPVLEFFIKEGRLYYRYQNVVQGFNLPLQLNENQWISPNENWQHIRIIDGKSTRFNTENLVEFRQVKEPVFLNLKAGHDCINSGKHR
ncbi:M1 family metallopeptidase [Cruoricaptor ignavus]|uniref:M1 family metallopeptidase n=1 Tax=Cruoricaptor ignavus TaxID=1118202 RepID=UPI00370D03E7